MDHGKSDIVPLEAKKILKVSNPELEGDMYLTGFKVGLIGDRWDFEPDKSSLMASPGNKPDIDQFKDVAGILRGKGVFSSTKMKNRSGRDRSFPSQLHLLQVRESEINTAKETGAEKVERLREKYILKISEMGFYCRVLPTDETEKVFLNWEMI